MEAVTEEKDCGIEKIKTTVEMKNSLKIAIKGKVYVVHLRETGSCRFIDEGNSYQLLEGRPPVQEGKEKQLRLDNMVLIHKINELKTKIRKAKEEIKKAQFFLQRILSVGEE